VHDGEKCHAGDGRVVEKAAMVWGSCQKYHVKRKAGNGRLNVMYLEDREASYNAE